MQPWLKKADPYPPNEKLGVCGAVREHCKDAKLLELHMGSHHNSGKQTLTSPWAKIIRVN